MMQTALERMAKSKNDLIALLTQLLASFRLQVLATKGCGDQRLCKHGNLH